MSTETELTLVSIATFVGFFVLAALLLVPVYRFLKREEDVAARHDKHTRT